MKFQSGKSSEGDFQVYMYGYPNESNHDLHVHTEVYVSGFGKLTRLVFGAGVAICMYYN